jgi:hypothetical protein
MEIKSNFLLFSKRYVALLTLLGMACALFADPPKPPLGKRWVLNPLFSDEFNGDTRDATKWYDHHPTWIGRPPGLFMPSQVSVRDGYLQIRGEKMEKDTLIHAYGRDITFNIAGGAVRSKNQVYLGYFECRVKAAATTMSTTFWFSGGGGKGPNGCDSYHQEWDIQECVGREGDFDGSYFASGMHANAHYWYTDCAGERFDHRAVQVKFEDSELASENFHVYGGWWRDASTASYYYDNREPKHQKFYDKISKTPMDKPMYMNLVCETYPFPWIELPSDEELADPKKNTVSYDWVRGYKLIDARETLPVDLKTKTLPEIYDEGLSFPAAILELQPSASLSILLTYKANRDREIHLTLYDPEENKIWETSLSAYAGYAHFQFNCEIGQVLDAGSGYKLEGSLRPDKSPDSQVLDKSVLFIDLSNKPQEKPLKTDPSP